MKRDLNTRLSLARHSLVSRSLFIYIGLFSYIQVSFHIYTSLFIYLGLHSYIQVSFHVYRSLFIYIQVSFHTCRSLFRYVGLFSYIQVSFIYIGPFSYMQVSFHIERSLFIYIYVSIHIYVRLFSCIQVSFHIYRSLLIEMSISTSCATTSRLCSRIQDGTRQSLPSDVHVDLFSRSLFTYIGLFSYLQVSFHIYRSLLTSFATTSRQYSKLLDDATNLLLSSNSHLGLFSTSLFMCIGLF